MLILSGHFITKLNKQIKKEILSIIIIKFIVINRHCGLNLKCPIQA